MRRVAKTSLTHPLRIDSVPFGRLGGRIGMTFCPGKKQARSKFGSCWDRDLDVDLQVVRAWGADTLVTLLEEHEFDELEVPSLRAACQRNGIDWIHIPIVDGAAPDERFTSAWPKAGQELRDRLAHGEAIVIHCKGGLGRTGTLAAVLLIEGGASPAEAIALVRTARDGAIETVEQERFLAGYGRQDV